MKSGVGFTTTMLLKDTVAPHGVPGVGRRAARSASHELGRRGRRA